MMRKRRSSISGSSACPLTEWSASRTLFLAAIVVVAIGNSRGEYLMGGHLDNKENRGSAATASRRSDEESESNAKNPAIISSRTATSLEDLDHDFDLGLDLLAEQTGVDPSEISSSPSEDALPNGEEPGIAPRYRVPLVPYAFNGGQPFSLEKDPITGQIDFEKAPPLKVLDYSAKSPADEPSDDSNDEEPIETVSTTDSKSQADEGVGPNEINPYSPSFHDFLNLPVRYTYNKYENSEKYPLISSSYANTKVQSGASSYNTYNHKKYHESVKVSVDAYLQPSRKTHIQSVTRATTKKPSTEPPARFTVSFMTPKTTTTTTEAPTTTTTTPAPTIVTTTVATTTTTKRPSTYPAVTTWKPQRLAATVRYPGDDYEGTLPIERLQPVSVSEQKTTTTEPSRYVSPSSRPSTSGKIDAEEETSEEYDEGYEDYDHMFQSNGKPAEANNDRESDYSYGLDFFGVGSRPSLKPLQTSTEKVTVTSSSTSTSPSSTHRPISSTSPVKFLEKENEWSTTTTTTTSRPQQEEEKRVTSMPLDTGDRYVGNYGNNGQLTGSIDNSIPSVTSNVVYHQQRPSNSDRYYARPPMGMSAPGIVVKSTSNVVVPPGQDTVSFVLGNRQSVGGAGDAGGEYYPVHTGSINDRTGITFGTIGNSRPINSADGYPGQMIVSAGMGIGSNAAGNYAGQSNGNPPFDHALVSVGLPTVDVVNPGDVHSAIKNSESSTQNSADSLAQKWWASTSSASANQQQNLQQQETLSNNQHNQFGYHVVFPDKQKKPSSSVVGEKPAGSIEEHVIVVHESEIGAGNALHLDLPSKESSSGPTTGFFHETSTQRFTGKPEEHGLPELSENLTPPAERPNRVQQGHRPSNYNYYHHHQSHSPSNSRPNEYPRPQRLPLPPSQSSSSSSSSSPSSSNGGFKRRPPPSSLDSNLPNILPQFRPNAKVSHGHNRGDNVGTIPAGALAHYPNPIIRRQPLSPPHHHHHHHRPSSSRRPTGPSHLQRLNPPPLPPPPPPIGSLRLPTPAALIGPAPGSVDQHELQQKSDNRLTVQKRLHQVSVGVPPSLNIDERHQSGNFGPQQAQQIKSRLEDENLERFSAEPPQQPPRAPFFGKRTSVTGGDHNLEGIPRIATLQMIQQHGGDDSIVKTNLPPPFRFNLDNRQGNRHEAESHQDVADENSSAHSANRRGDESSTDSSVVLPQEDPRGEEYGDSGDSPVYVVYPVKGALDIRPTSHEGGDDAPEDASVVLGKYGPQRPLPPDTLLKDSNEESSNDDRHGYRPAGSSFSDSSSSPQLASDFPYPLERPDPSIFTSQLREKPLLVPSEHPKNSQDVEKAANERDTEDNIGEETAGHDAERDASVNVIPYPQDHIPFGLSEHSGAISATLHRLGGFSSIVDDSSSTPIAYVYTPTMRPPIRRPEEGYGHASFERTPVLLQSQHASSTSSGPAAPQSFMAPFVASASAEAPTKNGWSVVVLGQSPGAESTNMDRRRADGNVQSEGDSKLENQQDEKEESQEDGEDEEENEKDEKEVEKEKKKEEPMEKDTQTEKSEFNVENFTPQLFGGFKPIFEFPSDTDTDPTLGDKVSGGALAIERPRSGTETAKISERKLESV